MTSRLLQLTWLLLRCLFVAVLLVLAAWVLSNLKDQKPQPLADALRIAPVTLDPRVNAYFGLMGLWAETEPPEVAGKAAWDETQAWLVSHPEPRVHDAAMPAQRTQKPNTLAPFPTCDRHAACYPVWREKAEAVGLALSARPARVIERCERLAGMRFEEDVGQVDMLMLFPAAVPLTECMRVFNAQALLSWQRGDAPAALKQLELGQQMALNALQGSRSLVSRMTAARMLRLNYEWVGHMAAQRPSLAPGMKALAAPISAEGLDPRRVMGVEVAFSWLTASAIRNGCYSASLESDRPAMSVTRFWLCDHLIPLAFHPEQSRNDSQRQWLAAYDALGQPMPRGLEALQATAAKDEAWWQRLSWRNTGARYFRFEPELSQYAHYVARHYDLELHRLALLAALEAGARSGDESVALARMLPSAYSAERLRWNPKAGAIEAVLWEQGSVGQPELAKLVVPVRTSGR